MVGNFDCCELDATVNEERSMAECTNRSAHDLHPSLTMLLGAVVQPCHTVD